MNDIIPPVVDDGLAQIIADATEAFGKTPEPVAPVAEPVVEAPVAEPAVEAPVAEPVVEAPAALHPTWAAALETVPEIFRGPLIEQIRTTERESQKAIEAARAEVTAAQTAVPEEWRDLISKAQEAQATPDNVVAAWNSSIAIAQDPVAFFEMYRTELVRQVEAGTITLDQAKLAALGLAQQQASGEQFDLRTPEQAQLADMQAKLAAMESAEQQRQQAQVTAQQQQDAEAYVADFVGKLQAATPGFTDAQRQVIGFAADRIMENSERAGTPVTAEAAIQGAIVGGGFTPAAAAPTPVTPAVAPTLAPAGSSVPAPAKITFKTEADREQAMILAAQAATAM